MTEDPASEIHATPAEPRARLLAAVMAHVAAHGVTDLSLRELAAAVGTSHRMLIYHFGSKEGLLVAVVQAMEAAQLAGLTALGDDVPIGPAETIRTMWRRFADPALGPHERLFFELYGQALQGRPGTVGMLDGIVESWIGPTVAFLEQQGVPTAAARADARLGVAVMRGLLLDLLATADRAGVDDAVERYIQMYEAVIAAPPPEERRLP